MVQKRVLPDQRNPLILPEHTPALDILIERRRLGQTNLQVKAGQVAHSNAASADSNGLFDYAHLRVPLPKDLGGSGIFSLTKNQSYPESYFLMRRSSDGFISATGMFKAAFPWASTAEEEEERHYHGEMTSAGEEVAGNVWVSPEDALKLADDYAMKAWIVALLDPEPIEKGTKDKGSHEISTPPKFVVADKASLFPPQASNMRTRSLRSASPTKASPRKIASPRKPRATRKAAKEAREATPSALREVEAETPAQSEFGGESVNGDNKAAAPETVRVEVDETTQKQGEIETTTTAVKVDVPAEHPQMPLPEDPQQMIAEARKMVEAANKAEGASSSSLLKRKADDAELEDPEDKAMEVQPAKRNKNLEEQLRKEKVKSKAYMGLSATLAIGALIPFLQSLL